MTIPANSNFTLSDYVILDSGGVSLRFLCDTPGPGANSYYTIGLTDTEVAAITNLASAKTLVTGKLQRLIRGTGIASKLDTLIGASVTV